MEEYQEQLHFSFIFNNETPNFSLVAWLPDIKTKFPSLPCS